MRLRKLNFKLAKKQMCRVCDGFVRLQHGSFALCVGVGRALFLNFSLTKLQSKPSTPIGYNGSVLVVSSGLKAQMFN